MHDARMQVRLSSRMKREVIALAGKRHTGSFARQAISEKLLRPSTWASHRFAEVQLQPRVGGNIDSMLEILASRHPTVADLTNADIELDPGVKRALYQGLSQSQARRVELCFTGVRLEAIGHMEGCSKQAVWATVRRAIDKLRYDLRFVQALCAAFPEAGYDPYTLMEAIRGRQDQIVAP